jgi:hypothetical protein
MPGLEILNPVAHVSTQRTVLAPRLENLENKRIGLYWNAQVNGEVLLRRTAQLLESRYKGIKLTLIPGSMVGTRERLEEAKTFDGVIASIAN